MAMQEHCEGRHQTGGCEHHGAEVDACGPKWLASEA
jgi:hypothetical protein